MTTLNLLSVLVIGAGAYFIYKAIKKSMPEGKNESPGNVQTVKIYEEPKDCQTDPTYHNHDYSRRGPPIRIEPGLYGTERKTYVTPSGNLQVDDGR